MVKSGPADSGADGEAPWFLAQIKPNSLAIAERNLARQGFGVFSPKLDITQRKHGRFVSRPEPLFPGYLFVSFDLQIGGWRAVNSTFGVTRLVSFGGDPAPVPMELIEDLMERCGADGSFDRAPVLTAGDRVRIVEGPFSDFVATVSDVAPNQRVWLLLDIMGRSTRFQSTAGTLRAL